MISKSTESSFFYKKDICCNSDDDKNPEEDEEKEKDNSNDRKCSIKELLKAENFIISMESQWKTIFDTAILFVIGYSCFTTVLYISFEIKMIPILIFIDNFVMACFAMDFFFNFF
jgi:hypothetical protein